MTEIVLSEAQARVMAQAGEPVTIRDPAGRAVGVLDPAEAEVLRRWRDRKAAGSPEPVFTSEQVHRHVAALQMERERLGDRFDRETMLRYLAELHAADPPALPAAGN